MTDNQRKAIQAWAQRTSIIKSVDLFGSRAKGTARPGSDVDLAVKITSENPSGDLICEVAGWELELNKTTGLKVCIDSVTEPVIAAAVNDHGVAIYRR